MANKVTVRKWSKLYGLPITIPSEGRQVGILENFYYEPDSGSISSLLVAGALQQKFALSSRYILSIEPGAITIPNANVLIERKPDLPSGHKLLQLRVVGESGLVAGTVGEILIGVVPPTALRVSAFIIADARAGVYSRSKSFTTNNIIRYEPDRIIVSDQVANKLT